MGNMIDILIVLILLMGAMIGYACIAYAMQADDNELAD